MGYDQITNAILGGLAKENTIRYHGFFVLCIKFRGLKGLFCQKRAFCKSKKRIECNGQILHSEDESVFCVALFVISMPLILSMKLLMARILISAVVILFLGWLLPGVEVDSSWKAVVAALVLALINAFIRPFLVLLTLPVTIFTLGLFLFVINALTVLLAAKWVAGFSVNGFWWALLFSFLLGILNSWIQGWALAGQEEKPQRRGGF